MPSVCTAHQAEPQEAEAEVPQVSHHLTAFYLQPSSATLAVHKSHVSYKKMGGSRENTFPFICLPYRTLDG